MTEAGPVLSMCLAFAKEPFEIKSGACGTVVRNAEMKIVDPETGASLGRNQSGEICIRGDQIMKGMTIISFFFFNYQHSTIYIILYQPDLLKIFASSFFLKLILAI